MKLVTGGTSRIGREIVKRLGDDVLVHYYKNRQLAESLSRFVIQADLSNREGIEGFLSRLGEFDVIINNFGFYSERTFDFEEWHKFLGANLILPALLMDHIDAGSVVNISSIVSHPDYPTGYLYGATKSALNKLTSTYHKDQVRVNAVAPAEVGSAIQASEVASEVIRVINSNLNNQIIYLWGTDPGRPE